MSPLKMGMKCSLTSRLLPCSLSLSVSLFAPLSSMEADRRRRNLGELMTNETSQILVLVQ